MRPRRRAFCATLAAHYAGRKLRRDPIFPAAYELLRESNEPLLDVGCGVGLLAFYLRERNFLAADQRPRQ